MGTINYTILSGEMPMTVTLKQGETTIDFNEHTILGSYSFTNVAIGTYAIYFFG